MGALRRWTSRAAAILRGRAADRELDAEFESHLQLHIEDNVRAGMSHVEARRHALRRFGPMSTIREEYRDARGVPFVEQSLHDVRYALRLMRKHPGFTAVAIISIALGVGANALIFSIVNAVILRPLPIARPDEVVFLEHDGRFTLSYPAYRDYRERNVTFADLAGYRISPLDLDAGRLPQRAWAYLATGNYFEMLGVRPHLGRLLTTSDDRPEAAAVAVLSYDGWTQFFGRDPAIVGTVVRINRQPFTIVGVGPENFRGTEVFYQPAVWIPMARQPVIEVGNAWLDNRFTANTQVIGRLRAGAPIDAAAANLTAIASQLGREYPRSDAATTQFALVRPGLLGSALRTPVTAFTVGVLALAALVLLIASVNLAAALTARGSDRQRELALRIAIGAGRGRLVRQILVETLVLVSLGGLAGWLIAVGGASALSRVQLPVELPVTFDVRADPVVLAFAFGVSLVTALVAGLAPARQAARTDPNAALKGGARFVSTTGLRFAARDVLVVAQVTLCVVLVSACLLSLRGLREALMMRVGLEPDGVAMVGFDLGLAGYDPAAREAFQRRALDAAAQAPGVTVAAYGNSVPLSIDLSTTTIFPANRPGLEPQLARSAAHYKASPGYFRAIGTRLVAGRDFDWRDTHDAPRVAIVNVTFARSILGVEQAVGERFAFGQNGPFIEVIGVVEDGKYASLSEAPRAAVFDPILQLPSTNAVLLARTSLREADTVAMLTRIVHELDPQLTVYQAENLRDMLGLALFPSRAAAIALTAFGLLAAILAGTGIYGVVAYSVARRVREIGVRVAIGASPGQVLGLVFVRVGVLMLLGGVIGLTLALLTSRVLASIVYQASPDDPVVVGGVIACVVMLGIAASWAPARRALRLNPTTALRAE